MYVTFFIKEKAEIYLLVLIAIIIVYKTHIKIVDLTYIYLVLNIYFTL